MEKYTQILEIMFKHVSSKEILKNHISYSEFGKDTFVLLANSYIPHYSNNEVENLFLYLQEENNDHRRHLFGEGFCDEHFGYGYTDEAGRALNVFDILLEFSEHVLMENGNVPVCNYSRLLRWRTTAHKLEEDLFVSAFLAYRDSLQPNSRRDLRWDLVLGTNNVSLQQLLDRGLAENHFHLKGSAPYFHLSWISMMNDMCSPVFERIFESYDSRRQSGKYSYNPVYGEEPLVLMYKQAAFIRIMLYMKLCGIRFVLGPCMIETSILKNYLDFDLLHERKWNKDRVREYLDSRYRHYDRVSIAGALNMNEQYSGLSEYEKKVVANILDGLWFDRALLEGKSDELTLGDIVENALKPGVRIMLSLVEGLIPTQKYREMEEEENLRLIYKILNNPDMLLIYQQETQNLIQVQRWEQAAMSGSSEISDYAVPSEYRCEFVLDDILEAERTPEEAKNILTGERWILYHMFQKYYNKDQDFLPYMNLFYAYLVIKENIRAELIQVNANVGFSNFNIYESRKEDFIENTVFEKYFLRITAWDILKRRNIVSLEARVTPKFSPQADMNAIRKYDSLQIKSQG